MQLNAFCPDIHSEPEWTASEGLSLTDDAHPQEAQDLVCLEVAASFVATDSLEGVEAMSFWLLPCLVSVKPEAVFQTIVM